MKIFICALLFFIFTIFLNHVQSMGSEETRRKVPEESRRKVSEEFRLKCKEESSRTEEEEESRRMRLAESRRRSLQVDRRIARELRHSTLDQDCYVYFNDRPLRVPPGGMIHQIQKGIFIPDVAFRFPIPLIVGDVIRRRGELFAKVVMEGETQIIYRIYQGALTDHPVELSDFRNQDIMNRGKPPYAIFETGFGFRKLWCLEIQPKRPRPTGWNNEGQSSTSQSNITSNKSKTNKNEKSKSKII